jgi:hypothetical protein
MEYLLEVQWTDPTAESVARILSTLPDEVEGETGAWPGATSRAFCVLRARDRQALDRILSQITEIGAHTRVVAAAGTDAPPRAA